ncbi:TPA: DUF4060 family protein [Escherichia coli]
MNGKETSNTSNPATRRTRKLRSKQSPIGRRACDVALAAHLQTYGDYGRSKMKETYTVKVEGVKVWVEVVNRKASYVATAMTGMRRLRSLPGQVG